MIALSTSIHRALVLLMLLVASACGLKFDQTIITYRLEAQIRINGETLDGSTV